VPPSPSFIITDKCRCPLQNLPPSNADACSYGTKVCDASDDHYAFISLSSDADNVAQGRQSRPPWSLVIAPHLRHPPAAFQRHHQPLLIVEYDLC
jgi:hypothetical protein